MNELLNEYYTSLAGVRKLIRKAISSESNDLPQLRAMERDLEWTIEYMTTGYPPKGRSTKSIPVDPQKVLIKFSQPLYAPTLPIERIRLQMLSALDILSLREREAFLMIVGEGLSYSEVAKMMGVCKSTVQTYVERAKAKISERRKCRVVRNAYISERNISA